MLYYNLFFAILNCEVYCSCILVLYHKQGMIRSKNGKFCYMKEELNIQHDEFFIII